MPRRRKYSMKDLPDPGAVFAMPLADGRVGICRVLQKKLAERNTPYILIAASDWIGKEPPSLADSSIRRLLRLTHHNQSEEPAILWVAEPPPSEFRLLGCIDVIAEDLKVASESYSGWLWFSYQSLSQWRWEHDRESVLVEDAAKKILETEKRMEAAQRRASYLSTVPLAKLLAKDLFPSWKNYPRKKAKVGCQNIIRKFISALEAAAKPLGADFVAAELQVCVEAINQLDSDNAGFIESIERDDICDVLEVVLNAAKHPELAGRIGDWREW